MASPDLEADADRSGTIADQLFMSMLGALELGSVYLGDRLGWYRSLDADGPATPEELASRTATDSRYAREWLEQQAMAGFVDLLDDGGDPTARRFALPEALRPIFVDPVDESHLAPFSRQVVACLARFPELVDRFRSGAGLSWEAYGPDLREGQGAGNRPAFHHHMAEWIGSVAPIDARLRADPPARIADVACGVGWSSIEMARAYPTVTVDGLDLDAPAIAAARVAADEAGLADRVTFHVRDAADPALAQGFDLVTVFEALHDLARPVEFLQAARGLLAPGGSVLVMDERADDTFVPSGDPMQRMLYAFSVAACLPNARAEEPSAATGTLLRPAAVRAMASDAGFTTVDVLPIEHPQFRFYRLLP
jgi:2-polyprenyl-3-methyl-5-hydroxy-6-metoxy-1,4-benzoquinol methylase